MRLWTISKVVLLMTMSKMTIRRMRMSMRMSMRMGMRMGMMMRTRMIGMRWEGG